jgi:hypothetical protein
MSLVEDKEGLFSDKRRAAASRVGNVDSNKKKQWDEKSLSIDGH